MLAEIFVAEEVGEGFSAGHGAHVDDDAVEVAFGGDVEGFDFLALEEEEIVGGDFETFVWIGGGGGKCRCCGRGCLGEEIAWECGGGGEGEGGEQFAAGGTHAAAPGLGGERLKATVF